MVEDTTSKGQNKHEAFCTENVDCFVNPSEVLQEINDFVEHTIKTRGFITLDEIYNELYERGGFPRPLPVSYGICWGTPKTTEEKEALDLEELIINYPTIDIEFEV